MGFNFQKCPHVWVHYSIGMGKQSFERRVVAQYITVKALLDFIIEYSPEIKQTVKAEREHIEEIGKTYNPTSKFSLFTGSDMTRFVRILDPTFDYASGTVTNATNYSSNYYYDSAVRYRTRPTAYVLPADGEGVAEALEIIKKHDVYFYKIDGKVTIDLKQYIDAGATTEFSSYGVAEAKVATLTDSSNVTFENGAYVFPLNQLSGLLLMYLFEPDVTDTQSYDSSLVQSGTLTHNVIYRYEHDLEADGTVYTGSIELAPQGLVVTSPAKKGESGTVSGLDASRLYEYRIDGTAEWISVPSGSTEITGLSSGKYAIRFADVHSEEFVFTVNAAFEGTIYVDSANGDDTNSGLTESTALKTITAAYNMLKTLLQKSGESGGNIVLLSNYVITAAETPTTEEFTVVDKTNARIYFPEMPYAVTISGKTGNEIFESKYTITFGGDTTLSNLSIKNAHTTNYRYLCGGGHKFVLGEGLKSVGSYRFMLVGGDYSGATVIKGVDMTVLSGSWQNVYLASYVSGGMTGDVNVNIIGATINGNIQTSLNSCVDGKINLYIENSNILGNIFAGYCGTSTIKTAKDMNADVIITLAGNTKAVNLYAGNTSFMESGNIKGKVTVIVNGATVSGVIKGGSVTEATKPDLSELVILGDSVNNSNFNNIYYDLDKDGKITSNEAAIVANAVANLSENNEVYDVNGDGVVDVNDVVLYITFSLYFA